MTGVRLMIRGLVQGVGFRPTVYKIAHELGLSGDVVNTSEGVEVRLWGQEQNLFIKRLQTVLPSLADIHSIEESNLDEPPLEGFNIAPSVTGAMKACITPDAATCPACLDEMLDPMQHRYWYSFNNCTNCGPRFSIIEGAPYDRDNTSMRNFEMCATCEKEFLDPTNRRFHAQPIACALCGPRAWLEKIGTGTVNSEAFSMMDDVDAAGGAIMNGFIVAIKGLGGVHLACDATKGEVVEKLRLGKKRRGKAFALMARDMNIIREYAEISEDEARILSSPEAPIVLLKAKSKMGDSSAKSLPESVVPGLDRLGFMLPNTPMHHILLRRMKRPVVMTSGNISGEPQCTTNEQVHEKLVGLADFALLHNRDISNRIDDSVVSVMGKKSRLIRRARGYAPKPIALPDGFDHNHQVLALGAELKNTFCLIKNGQAIVSQHMGDLENIATHIDVEHNLDLYTKLFEHNPSVIAVDQHPEYLSTKKGYQIAGDRPVIEVQHHHAHIAACMAENNCPLNTNPILGIAMDGLGLGGDGTIWGGEFFICDYSGYQRVACLKPVPLIGGERAVHEPGRNLYAHLMAEMGWEEFAMNFNELEIYNKLNNMPRAQLDQMVVTKTNAYLSSSCGRLFDAVAALVDLSWDAQNYEGEAAMKLESVLHEKALQEPDELAYPFTIPLMGGNGMPYIEPVNVWRAILGDLLLDTPIGTISARFHRGLAKAICQMAQRLTADSNIDTVALSGGCFQNTILFELVLQSLEQQGLNVLSHTKLPTNDGGISMGQATIALATIQKRKEV